MKCLIDSCIFIENFKGIKKVNELFLKVVENFECFITEIVFSEVFYKVIGLKGEKSPLTLKNRREISTLLKKAEIKTYMELLTMFKTLEANKNILQEAYNLAVRYNLLPNDALLLASCKHYKIDCLISVDKKDFAVPCEREKVVLVSSVEKLSSIYKT